MKMQHCENTVHLCFNLSQLSCRIIPWSLTQPIFTHPDFRSQFQRNKAFGSAKFHAERSYQVQELTSESPAKVKGGKTDLLLHLALDV